MIFRLIVFSTIRILAGTKRKAFRSIRFFCFCSYPEEFEEKDKGDESDLLVDFCLLELGTFSEKKGFSLVWVHDPSQETDLWGRGLLGFYKHYNSYVIDILWLRILIS